MFFAAVSVWAKDYASDRAAADSRGLAAMLMAGVLLCSGLRWHRQRMRRKKVRAGLAAVLEFRR
jgi:type II secretory pathway component PulF